MYDKWSAGGARKAAAAAVNIATTRFARSKVLSDLFKSQSAARDARVAAAPQIKYQVAPRYQNSNPVYARDTTDRKKASTPNPVVVGCEPAATVLPPFIRRAADRILTANHPML